MRDQVALHDKLQCTVAFHIHGVSLFAFFGRKDRDNGTAVRLVFIDDVAETSASEFHVAWTKRLHGLRDDRFSQSILCCRGHGPVTGGHVSGIQIKRIRWQS
jgi:hypothetical protein